MENCVKRQAINKNPAIADFYSALFSKIANSMASGCWGAGSQFIHEHRNSGGGRWRWNLVSDGIGRGMVQNSVNLCLSFARNMSCEANIDQTRNITEVG